MNKVLKDNDDPHGICVYIAPTKALVNQVAGKKKSFFLS
jgi:replicative superfamily II helicase